MTELSSQESQRSGYSGFRWVVLALIFLIYTLAYADRTSIGIALPSIKKEFDLSNTEAGSLVSAFAVVYACAQIPAALLVGRFGVRRTLPAAMVLTSLVTFGLGLSATLEGLLGCRLALGLVEAPLAIGLLTTINNWFPANEKGTASGVFLSSTKFAPLVVPPIGALLLIAFGWRSIFLILSIPGALLALMWLMMVADSPKPSGLSSGGRVHESGGEKEISRQISSKEDKSSKFGKFDALIRSRDVVRFTSPREVLMSFDIWCVAAAHFFVQGTIAFMQAWLPSYLTEYREMAILSTGIVSAVPFAGAVIGSFAGGFLSDRLLGGRRKPAMLVGSAATVVTMGLLTSAPDNLYSLELLLFLTGFFLSVGLPSFTIYGSRMADAKTYPLTLSVINMCGSIGGAAFPFATGLVLDRFGWGYAFYLPAVGCALAVMLVVMAVEPREDAREPCRG